MTGRELRRLAVDIGEEARFYIDGAYDGAQWGAADDFCAYDAARTAAHYANLALESERVRDAPANTIIHNRLLLAQRIASTPHCGVCGGKIKRIKRHGKLVGFECAKCGRTAAWPQENVNEAPVGDSVKLAVSIQANQAADEGAEAQGVMYR